MTSDKFLIKFLNKMDRPNWSLMEIKDEVDGQTKDSSLSSRTSQETVHSEKNFILKYKVEKNHGKYKLVIACLLLLIFGVIQIVFPLYNVLLNLRLRMTPGLPAYEWWLDPPDAGIVKVYIFNVTNAERFSNKTDKKIKLEEIGPIVYRENLLHKNIVFNKNGTLSYTSNRTLEYLPDRNPEYLLNKTIIMPNLALLFIPSYLYDAPFFIRFGVNLMMRKLKTELFKTATIDEFFWNLTDPILNTAEKIAPSIIRTKNVGILNRIYENYEDNVTVYIGPKYGDKDFFRIDKYDGSENMPHLKDCNEKVRGSTEDLMYFQGITKTDSLRFFRKTLCRVANLEYKSEFTRYGMTGYRFEMEPNYYHRIFPDVNDCYKGVPPLPNGLIDVSLCNYDATTAASYPHFLYADSILQNSVEGLNPDEEKHKSFVEVEPITGIPFLGAARSQINLVVKDLKGFNEKLHKFSNLNIPLVWIEVVQEKLPLKIQWMVYIQVMVIPILQNVLLVFTFIAAFIVLLLFVKGKRRDNKRRQSTINKAFAFESSKFLKS